jgi:DNA-directed RNA polymerase subunit alpha
MALPKVEITKVGQNYGRYVIEPLEPGYGSTLGNSLRRILLSSLPGTAVTSVRIDGVWHEFSSIPGVREDVTEIVLNVKRIRLNSATDRPLRATLSVSHEGEVYASEVQWPAEVECITPEQYLFTIDGPGNLVSIEMTIHRGRGYEPAEAQTNLSIGEIPIDAIYTPIPRVNLVIEPTRRGDRTDYDRLIMEVWSDGTIDPSVAIADAAQILVQHADLIARFNRQPGPETRQAAAGLYVTPEAESKALADLGLSPRVLNALHGRKITKVGQVLAMDEKDLLAIRNFGQKSLDELREKLVAHGFLPEELAPNGASDGVGDIPPDEANEMDEEADLSPTGSALSEGEEAEA